MLLLYIELPFHRAMASSYLKFSPYFRIMTYFSYFSSLFFKTPYQIPILYYISLKYYFYFYLLSLSFFKTKNFLYFTFQDTKNNKILIWGINSASLK